MSNLKDPLLKNATPKEKIMRFTELIQQISKINGQIEAQKEVLSLQEFRAQLQQNEREVKQISQEIGQIIKQLDGNKTGDISKKLQRLKQAFQKESKRFVDVNKNNLNQSFHYEQQRKSSGKANLFDNEASDQLYQEQIQQQQEADNIKLIEVEYDGDILKENQQEIDQIGSFMNEVGGLQQETGQMIHAQGEQVEQIVVNVERAKDNTEEAKVEITKANTYSKKTRNKYLCFLLLIILVIGGIVGLIIGLA